MHSKTSTPSASKKSSPLNLIKNVTKGQYSKHNDGYLPSSITKNPVQISKARTRSIESDIAKSSSDMQSLKSNKRSISPFTPKISEIKVQTSSTTIGPTTLNCVETPNIAQNSQTYISMFSLDNTESVDTENKAKTVESNPTFRITYMGQTQDFLISFETNDISYTTYQVKPTSGVQIIDSMLKLFAIDNVDISDKIQNVQEKGKPVEIGTNADNESNPRRIADDGRNINIQASQGNDTTESKGPKKPDDKKDQTVNQNANKHSGTNNDDEIPTEEEIDDMFLDMKTLRMGVFIICTCHLMSIIIATVVFFLVYLSDMPYKINVLTRVGIAIGICVKGLHIAALFVGAYKENPVALHCANMLGWLVFLTQEVLGVMGFTFFVRIAHLTWNFLIAMYFACIVLTESISFCRNSLIVTAYRELLLSRPLDENVLRLALCCSGCNIAEFIKTSARRDPT